MNEGIMLFILSFLLTVLIGLIGFVWKDFSSRMKFLEKDNKEIKINYLDRFKQVTDLIYEVKILVKEQSAKCIAIQDFKKNENERDWRL